MGPNRLLDKCRGSLIGGAVGDALGYEVEFMTLLAIRKRFGQQGITRYVLHNGEALFSDDTQMSLFTVEGLLNAISESASAKPGTILPYIRKAYLNWYRTQRQAPEAQPDSWLSHIGSLWSLRAPGNTCMESLGNLCHGYGVYNNSKGCGGVMRVAPIGIFGAVRPELLSDADVTKLGGLSAEITHKHIDSTFASALMALIVSRCISEEGIDRQRFSAIVNECLAFVKRQFMENSSEWENFRRLIRTAIDLGMSDVSQYDSISELGEGWVGDEALAIALFSVMRHINDFEQCIICAVNHDGDSDSTGAIAGNIIGAILGYSAIPQEFIDHLELHDVILSMADDLAGASSEEQRELRYIRHQPYNATNLI